MLLPELSSLFKAIPFESVSSVSLAIMEYLSLEVLLGNYSSNYLRFSSLLIYAIVVCFLSE